MWPNARLLVGYEKPLLDDSGTAMVLVYEQRGRVELRALELRDTHPAVLLARRLDKSPGTLAAASIAGDPRVQIRLGNVAAYAPGATEVTELAPLTSAALAPSPPCPSKVNVPPAPWWPRSVLSKTAARDRSR